METQPIQETQTKNSPIEAKPKTKKEDLEESFNLFDADPDYDIDAETTYEIKISKSTTDKILMISRMVKVAVLTISGYEEQPQGKGESIIYKLTKNPLASSPVIKHFQSLLEPYANESNMVSKKDWDSFKVQARADWGAFYRFCLREKASPEENERSVYRIFQDCLINIGEITTGNPQNMKTLFGAINDNMELDEGRNPFR